MKHAFKAQSHSGVNKCLINVQQNVSYNWALICASWRMRIIGIMVMVCIQTRPSCPPRDPYLLIAEQQCVRPNAAQWPCRCLCCLSMVFSIRVDDVIFSCAEGWRGYIELYWAFLAARSLTQHLCLAVTQPFTWCCQQKEKDIFNSSLEWCHWGYCSWNSSFPLQLFASYLKFHLLFPWLLKTYFSFDRWFIFPGWQLRSSLNTLCTKVIDYAVCLPLGCLPFPAPLCRKKRVAKLTLTFPVLLPLSLLWEFKLSLA